MKIRRILVPTDFSEISIAALEEAMEWARDLGAEVTALFVMQPLVYATPPFFYGALPEHGTIEQEQQRMARAELAELERRFARRKIPLRTRIETGIPHEAITSVARRTRTDLIVMATHGRTGLSHAFLGSVAERVLRTAPCAVLTLRENTLPKGRRSKGRARRTTRKRAPARKKTPARRTKKG